MEIDCRDQDEATSLRAEVRRLRTLLDILHVAHHRWIDRCPLCEEVAEAGGVTGVLTHG
jgi:hypothetical protein